MPKNIFSIKSKNADHVRPLTANEIKLAQSVFQNAIKYEYVSIHNATFYPLGLQHKDRAVAYKDKISAPGKAYSADFSLDTDPVKQSVFIHELVHVWQHQNDVLDTRLDFIREMISHRFNNQACYRYKLNGDRDLLDYDFEQQAAIIQDYFLLKNHGIENSYKERHLLDMSLDQLTEAYEFTLKKFIKNPGYARMYEEKAYSTGLLRLLPVPKESRFYFPEKHKDL